MDIKIYKNSFRTKKSIVISGAKDEQRQIESPKRIGQAELCPPPVWNSNDFKGKS